MSIIMIGFHSFLPVFVRQQRFWNYEHEECTAIPLNMHIFYLKKNISTNARKMSGKIQNRCHEI